MPTPQSKISLNDWHLYVILDRTAARGRDLALVAEAAVDGGADVLQLRDKTASTSVFIVEAKRILAVTQRHGVPLIINDRADVALASDADGVHLGQDDLPITVARRILGSRKIIGRSTHSLEQALEAEREGADYLGVGPIFATPTKPDYAPIGLTLVSAVAARMQRPWAAIGGIDTCNVATVVRAGARCVAVVRAVVAADDPRAAARQLKDIVSAAVKNGTGALFPAAQRH